MDEETNRIKQYIDGERAELGRNLDEIEHRVRNATDLKAHFDKNTGLFLGAAVAGGFLLSRAFRESAPSDINRLESGSIRGSNRAGVALSMQPISRHLHRLSETLDDIFDGLVEVASDKLRVFVADKVPGFQAKYDAMGRQTRSVRPTDLGPNDYSVAK